MPQAFITQRNKLSVQEWFYHRIHALLGFYCLTHFIYRFGIFLGDNDASDMGFEKLTARELVGIFLPHVALQLSGFVFDIPQKRYPDGFRIWPQYRYEALVFVGRSLTLMAIAWHRRVYGCGDGGSHEGLIRPGCTVWLPAMVVMATSLSADSIASYFQYLGQKSSTLRDLTAPPGALYLAAAAQFHCNVHCLLTADKLCVQLAALAVVQITSFFLTLRRKGVITVPQGIVLYGLVLVLGMAVIVNDLMDRGILSICFTLGNVAALLRFDFRLNKYALWSLAAFFLQWLSAGSDGPFDAKFGGESIWQLASIFSTGLLFLGAARRQQQMAMKVVKEHQT